MDLAASAQKRVNGRAKHLWPTLRRPETLTYQTTQRGTCGKAVDALFPWTLANYPGRIKGALAVLNGRATARSLKNWMRGDRRAPQWAWVLIVLAIERRIVDLQHALELAKKEAGD